MTLQDLVAILKEGGLAAFAGIFLWLYLSERKENRDMQKERVSDLKISTEALHKSVALLDEARNEAHRRAG